MARYDETPIVFEVDRDRVVLQEVTSRSDDEVLDGSGEVVLGEDGRPRIVSHAEVVVCVLDDGDDPEDPRGETMELLLLEDREQAGLLARSRSRWNLGGPASRDLSDSAVREVVAMIGADTLVRWALGQAAGPGTAKVRSLPEWFDLSLQNPEEELATWDNDERDVSADPEESELSAQLGVDSWSRLREALGFSPGVAYRTN